MTFVGFIAGALMMIAGFAMVRYTDKFLMYLGDISEMFGVLNARWISWKLFGTFLLIVGFMIAFGIFELFFLTLFGRALRPI